MSIDHWMIFGTFAEQQYFEYPKKGTYQGVIINANMAAHAPAGLAAFLLERTAGLKYLIDPMTHAFQHDPSAITKKDGEPKSSIATLANHYGSPVDDTVGKRPLFPIDFSDTDKHKEWVERCLLFQMNHIVEYMKESDAAKYLGDEAQEPPYALVAPYFFLSEDTIDMWLDVCIESIKLAIEVCPDDSKILAAVVISRAILTDSAKKDEVSKAFSALDVDGFLLWVDGLEEQTASKAELTALVKLSTSLSNQGKKEVINRHGGYFSVLAAGKLKRAMTGVAHGPEFGEFRGVVPVGGGIPIARYYIPKLHSRVRYRDTLRLLNGLNYLKDDSTFHNNVCECKECKDVLDGNVDNFTLFGDGTIKNIRRKHGIVRIEFPTGDTKKRCLKHYLQMKKLEYEFADIADKSIQLEELEKSAREFEPVAGLDGVAHLRRWKQILES